MIQPNFTLKLLLRIFDSALPGDKILAGVSLALSSDDKTDLRCSSVVFRPVNGETPFSENGLFSSFLPEADAVNFADADFAKISEMLLTDGERRDRFSGDFGRTGRSSSVVELIKQDNPLPIFVLLSVGLEPEQKNRKEVIMCREF